MSNETRVLQAYKTVRSGFDLVVGYLLPHMKKENGPLTAMETYCYNLILKSGEGRAFAIVDRLTEKRGFLRVPINTEVQVRAKGSTIRSQEGINISMSGIRLFTREAIPPAETPCHIAILLGGADYPVIIEAQGETVRSREGSLAVKFLELDPDSHQYLRQLVVNNASDPERAERELSAH